MSADVSVGGALVGKRAVTVFMAFAFAYFLSALLRAGTATLAPVFSRELNLGAAQLGLLAGAYFLGFSIMQLPVGLWLDRYGPKRLMTGLLLVATSGCAAFAMAHSMAQLLLSRVVIGIGVSACLMASLTVYRRGFDLAGQLRANSWMLMMGSLGMLASTLPTQWLLPLTGWRGLFGAVAGLLLLATLLILILVPADPKASARPATTNMGYSEVFRSPVFRRMAPTVFFSYGGMIAMQSLWIGPWLTQVGQRTSAEAAGGLFLVNASMLLAFLTWGLAMPRLIRARWDGERLIVIGWPLGAIALAVILWRGASAGPVDWAVWCVLTSVVSLSQPALAQAFPVALAGRALSAVNLVMFFGVFTIQWGLGLLIDALTSIGWTVGSAYRSAFAVFLIACVASFIFLHWQSRTARR